MNRTFLRSCLFSFLLLQFLFSTSSAIALTQRKTIFIKGATVIDGSGRRGFAANVRIADDKIIAIGNFQPTASDEVIDARGLTLAPGFIDIHNHSESGLLTEGTATSQISQGITTLAVGPDGGSPFPIADYLTKLENKISVNTLAFIGHATVRERVMGKDYKRQATKEEIARMAELVEQGMKDGAYGLSSGLEYDMGNPSSPEELIELARVAARYGGIYMSHIRDEEEGMLDALREAIRIGREARLPVQISHIKMGNRNVWNKAPEAIALINRERRAGFDVTADCYPYTAWASTITVLVPSRRHEDREAVDKGLKNVGGADKVLITSCRAHKDYEGKTLEEIAKTNNTTPADVYMQIVKDGGAGVVCSSMNEADVRAFYLQKWVMVSSDGGIGSRHPRGAGTFSRVLGRFVRAQHWLSLEEAIRKMSAMPARRLGLTDRGRIGKGMKADLVLFDAKRVIDRSTFKEPLLLSDGIEMVFVNGAKVWKSGKPTGELSGSVLRNKVEKRKP
jgi:N-acyl-D-amino-acid deacylase